MAGCHVGHFGFIVLAAAVLSTASCAAQDAPQQELTPEEVAEQEIAELRARAEQGLAEALVSLGDTYTEGHVVREDEEAAMRWIHWAVRTMWKR